MAHTLKSNSERIKSPNSHPFEQYANKKGLALPQLEILRVILEDENIDLYSRAQSKIALTAIQSILQDNGLKGLSAKSVYAQLHTMTQSPHYAKDLLTTAAKSYPLHVAAREGDLNELKKLISMGYQVNEADNIFGSTPLHMAAMYGHHEVAAYLLQKGADINAQTYVEKNYFPISAYTALDLALKYEPGTQTLELLLQKEAKSGTSLGSQYDALFDILFDSYDCHDYAEFDLMLSKIETLVKYVPECLYVLNDADDFFEVKTEILAIAPMLKELSTMISDLTFYNRFMTTIKVFDASDIDNIGEHYVLAKNLTHAFPSGESYLFTVGKAKGYIQAEGHFSYFTAPLATKAINDFSTTHLQGTYDYDGFNAIQKKYHYFYSMDQYETIKNNIFKQVGHCYDIAADAVKTCGLYQTSEQLFKQYLTGETLVLPTGWDGHAIDVILNKDLNLFMVANAGQQFSNLTSGLNAYNHKYAITADDIYHILLNTDKMELEFKRFYDLGLTVNEKFSFESEPQSFGNCAWYSQQVSEKALIYLELTKATGFDKLSLDLADIWFKQLDEFQQTSILKDYLAHPSLEVNALGDILIHYHSDLKTVDEIERAKLILDNLTLPENKVAFEQYCDTHESEITPQLGEFIQNHTINSLVNEMEHVLLHEKVDFDVINIEDVIKIDVSSELLAPLNPPQNELQSLSITATLLEISSELTFGPSTFLPSPVLQDQHQVVVAVLA